MSACGSFPLLFRLGDNNLPTYCYINLLKKLKYSGIYDLQYAIALPQTGLISTAQRTGFSVNIQTIIVPQKIQYSL